MTKQVSCFTCKFCTPTYTYNEKRMVVECSKLKMRVLEITRCKYGERLELRK